MLSKRGVFSVELFTEEHHYAKTLPTAGTSMLTGQKSSYRALQVASPETIRIDIDIFNKLSGLPSCEHAGT